MTSAEHSEFGEVIELGPATGFPEGTKSAGGRASILDQGPPPKVTDNDGPELISEFSSIVEKHGAPTIGRGAKKILNPMFIPAVYARKNKVLFDAVTRRFHEYNPSTGLWIMTSPERMRCRISDLTFEVGKNLGELDIALKERSHQKLESAYRNLSTLAEGGFSSKPTGFVHCTNGMLDVRTGKLHPFSPDFKSRNASPFAWNETAICPRFVNELLSSALQPEDILIIQLYMGMALMGRNLAQRILLLSGTAGGGKSSLCKTVEGLIGVQNCTEARTKHLAERFELARFVGKTLLTGKDVKGDFLMTEGAYVLKALSGGDLLETETKNGMSTNQIEGEFCIVITCNTRLRVRLDGDTDAWRRRLVKIDYERPKPAKPIPDFTNLLLTEEGSGILKWAVEGANKLLELEYAFPITLSQQSRVDSLLYESDALRTYVGGQIEKSAGDTLTTAEIVEAFFAFCDDRGWASSSVAQVERELPNAMMEIHRAAKSSSIERQGKAQKGFRGVKFAEKKQNGTDGTAFPIPNAYAE